jgi:hypothetical protein
MHPEKNFDALAEDQKDDEEVTTEAAAVESDNQAKSCQWKNCNLSNGMRALKNKILAIFGRGTVNTVCQKPAHP